MPGILSTLYFATLLAAISSLVIERREAQVVSFPIMKHKQINRNASPKERRAGTIQVVDTNYNHEVLYLIPLTVGTPPQTIMAQVDTGSPNLVLQTVQDNLCMAAAPNPCTKYGGYDANASSTYKYESSDFVIQYGGGDGATGDEATDVANVGGAALTGLYLGLQYQTTVTENIAGVLFTEDERNRANLGHTNIPLLLRNQGYIASRVYSLWTNSDTADAGRLVFGGIDTKKYYCNLVPQQLVPDTSFTPPLYADFDVAVASISGSDGTTTNTLVTTGFVANMDSGTTVMIVPEAIGQAIWTYLGATASQDDPNIAFLPCTKKTSSTVLKIAFTGITINIPLSQLLPFPDNASGQCQLAVEKSTSTTALFGDVILSSMYVVYDLDNRQLQFAQAVLNAAESNIVQIGSGPNAVPKVAGVQGPLCSTSTTTTSKTSTTTNKATTTTTKATTTTTKMTTTTTTKATTTTTKATTTTTKATTTTTKATTTTTKMTTTTTTKATSTTTKATSTTTCANGPITTWKPNPTICATQGPIFTYITSNYPTQASSFCSDLFRYTATRYPSNPTISSWVVAEASRVSTACSCVITQGPATKC